LRSVADPILLAAAQLGVQPISVFPDLIDKSAFMERIEQSKTHAAAEAGAFDHLSQPEDFARRLKAG